MRRDGLEAPPELAAKAPVSPAPANRQIPSGHPGNQAPCCSGDPTEILLAILRRDQPFSDGNDYHVHSKNESHPVEQVDWGIIDRARSLLALGGTCVPGSEIHCGWVGVIRFHLFVRGHPVHGDSRSAVDRFWDQIIPQHESGVAEMDHGGFRLLRGTLDFIRAVFALR